MVASNSQRPQNFGSQLVESASLKDAQLNLLFAALLSTALAVFLGGNALLRDIVVLKASAPVAAACFAMLLFYYAVSRILRSVGWGLAVVYGFLCLLAYFHAPWMLGAAYALGSFALAYAIRFLRLGRKDVLGVLWMMLIAAAVVLGCDGALTSFDVMQRIQAGDVSKDTVFHASIAAMIKNYGVTSTGLHGLIETPYHVLSHTLMAGISVLSGAGVLQVYGVAPWVAFVPILIFCVTASCILLREGTELSIPLTWGLACALLVLTPLLLSRWAFWNSYFVSESYLVSCGLFMLGLVLLFKRQLGVSDVFLAAILAALIANAKGSVGPVYAGLWALRVTFLQGWRSPLDLMTAGFVAIAVALITLGSVVANAPTAITMVPFEFIKSNSFLGGRIGVILDSMSSQSTMPWRSVVLAVVAVVSFFAFHFVFSWITLVQLVYRTGWPAVVRAPLALYVLGTVAVGGLIVIFFEFPAGSAYYFTSIAFFVSLPAVIALSVNYLERGRLRSMQAGLGSSAPLLLIACVSIGVGVGPVYFLVKSHDRHSSVASGFIASLAEVREKESLEVYLKPLPDALSTNPVSDCAASPFVYPAISERPWVGVVANRSDCAYEYYGYVHYGLTRTKQEITLAPRLLPGMVQRLWFGAP